MNGHTNEISILGSEAEAEGTKKSRSLAPLRMVYREAAKYPRQIALAVTALLVTAAATLAMARARLVAAAT